MYTERPRTALSVVDLAHLIFVTAFNSLFKTFYFHRTQRGGSINKGTGRQTRLEPMARWLQRRMLFLCGYTWEQIVANNKKHGKPNRTGRVDWVTKNGGTMEFCQRKVPLEEPNQDDMEDVAELDEWEFFNPGTTPTTAGTIVHGSTILGDEYGDNDVWDNEEDPEL